MKKISQSNRRLEYQTGSQHDGGHQRHPSGHHPNGMSNSIANMQSQQNQNPRMMTGSYDPNLLSNDGGF